MLDCVIKSHAVMFIMLMKLLGSEKKIDLPKVIQHGRAEAGLEFRSFT